ncbi:hypothetical protein D3C83_253540 [compost metagenome]
MKSETVGMRPSAFVRVPKTGGEADSQTLPADVDRSDQVTKSINPTLKQDATASLDRLLIVAKLTTP